ncbi:nucleotidyltransferase domain-containing protein [Candidatus Woesearchaeota archaeon]|nr:nucleotidyltransferase domain-containing protein [Candidatus Woesearchaeota archaeon]
MAGELERQIVGLYDENILAEYSINEIARRLGRKGYSFIYNKVMSMVADGVLNKRVVGTSSLCSLNLSEYNTILLLCQREAAKAKELFSHNKTLKGILDKLLDESKQSNTLHFVAVFGSYAKGTAREKSDVDLLVVVEDRKRETVSRVANTLSMAHAVELNAVVMDKKLFQSMLTSKDVNVGKEALRYHVVIYGCEKFFEYVREVENDLKI